MASVVAQLALKDAEIVAPKAQVEKPMTKAQIEKLMKKAPRLAMSTEAAGESVG